MLGGKAKANKLFVAEFYNNATPLVENAIKERKPIYMNFTTDKTSVMEDIKVPKEMYSGCKKYSHHFYGRLENGAKVHLIATNIDLYFDVLVPLNISKVAQKVAKQTERSGIIPERILNIPVRMADKHIWESIVDNTIANIVRPEFGTGLRYAVIGAKPLNLLDYTPDDYAFIRFYYSNILTRKKHIIYMRERGFCTFSDNTDMGQLVFDIGYNYQINLAGFNLITSYQVFYMPDSMGVHPIYHIIADIKDIYSSPFNSDRYPEMLQPPMRPGADLITRDAYSMLLDTSHSQPPVLLLYIDIETSTDELICPGDPTSGYEVPMHTRENDKIFMLCGVFRWASDPKPFGAFCIHMPKIALDPARVFADIPKQRGELISVDTEDQLLMQYYAILGRMRPDIYDGYNTSGYDYQFILSRIQKHQKMHIYFAHASSCLFAPNDVYVNDLGSKPSNSKSASDAAEGFKPNSCKYVISRINRTRRIKIVGIGQVEGVYIDIPSTISTDLYILMRKSIDGLPKYGLNDVLKFLKLPLKADMNIQHMFQVFKASEKARSNVSLERHGEVKDMNDVGYYCVLDCLACSNIWVKRDVILNMRLKAEIAFVDLNNTFFIADSFKCNSITNAVATGYVTTYFMPDPNLGDDKYPGGFVHPPTRPGLCIEYPTSELDFESLYPSIMTCFNISVETTVRSDAVAAKYRAQGILLREMEFIMTSGNKVHGYIVQHGDDKRKMGIYPHILQYLKAKRKIRKREMEGYEAQLASMSPNDPEYGAIDLQRKLADIAQMGYKLFMNTLYGTSGSRTSKLFNILIAGSITTLSVQMCKLAQKIAEDNGFFIYYGDTDSMYVHAPYASFAVADQSYYRCEITREEYWSQLCQINLVECDRLRDMVNSCMLTFSLHGYLKMSHDTIGMPSAWFSKKKYAYLIQLTTLKDGSKMPPRFIISDEMKIKRKGVFKIRGLEFIKGGHSAMVSEIGWKITDKIFDIRNIPEELSRALVTKRIEGSYAIKPMTAKTDISYDDDLIYRCVKSALIELINSSWDVKDFTRMGTYREGRKNVTFNRFIERLRERGSTNIPSSGEKFEYVYTRPTSLVNSFGCFIKYKVGDIIELPEDVIKYGLQIDQLKYIDGEFKGMFARFITHLFADRTIEVDADCIDINQQVITDEFSKETIMNVVPETHNSAVVDDTLDADDAETKAMFERAKAQVNVMVDDITQYSSKRKKAKEEGLANYKRRLGIAKLLFPDFAKLCSEANNAYNLLSICPAVGQLCDGVLTRHWVGITDEAVHATSLYYRRMELSKFMQTIVDHKIQPSIEECIRAVGDQCDSLRDIVAYERILVAKKETYCALVIEILHMLSDIPSEEELLIIAENESERFMQIMGVYPELYSAIVRFCDLCSNIQKIRLLRRHLLANYT